MRHKPARRIYLGLTPIKARYDSLTNFNLLSGLKKAD